MQIIIMIFLLLYLWTQIIRVIMVLISDGAEKRRRKHLFAIVVHCNVMAVDA